MPPKTAAKVKGRVRDNLLLAAARRGAARRRSESQPVVAKAKPRAAGSRGKAKAPACINVEEGDETFDGAPEVPMMGEEPPPLDASRWLGKKD